ncbi:MAG: putative MFS family arabinose efflux permease [Motiliproteus sp.]|jgi:predicted MFS family arabinose efflux permease
MLNPGQAQRQYLLVTANYWGFTLTDGALRMLVVLYFYQLGYAPLAIALLFVFYELFGVVTNLLGGWLGSRIGLNRTMNMGLALQVAALLMLSVPEGWLSVPYVMAAQALSGIAKDLNKMSAKSSVKQLVGSQQQAGLYRWIALLTGSKNTLKGVGFFLGGALLTGMGFRVAVLLMAAALLMMLLISWRYLRPGLGRTEQKVKFRDIFSTSRAVNVLSAARLFLFGARDVWFVIAVPVFLSAQLGWSHQQVGSFLALWIIGYGGVQVVAPWITGKRSGRVPDGRSAVFWAALLALLPALLAWQLDRHLEVGWLIVAGLALFGILFAINSSLHSYLIVSYAREEAVSLDVGFYYMANALGRLLGTLLSGWLFQEHGLASCLWVSTGLVLLAALLSLGLPRHKPVATGVLR